MSSSSALQSSRPRVSYQQDAHRTGVSMIGGRDSSLGGVNPNNIGRGGRAPFDPPTEPVLPPGLVRGGGMGGGLASPRPMASRVLSRGSSNSLTGLAGGFRSRRGGGG